MLRAQDIRDGLKIVLKHSGGNKISAELYYGTGDAHSKPNKDWYLLSNDSYYAGCRCSDRRGWSFSYYLSSHNREDLAKELSGSRYHACNAIPQEAN